MNRLLKRILLGAVVLVALVGATAFTAVEVRWTRTFDAPYPAIAATTDPAVIARGRYLAYGPAACAYCHVLKEDWVKLDQGIELPLSGAHVFRVPFGEFYSANVTPDQETGIGRRSDGELARILRHGVRADGRAAIPFMEFQHLSDDDVAALISFLRSRPPVKNRVPDHRFTFFGKTLMAFAIGPSAAAAPPPANAPAGLSVARGEYLANYVSSCVSCHTDRSTRDGSLIGPRFGGGQRMDVAADPTKVFVPPNLTPDPTTSPIGIWTEEVFLVRLHAGEAVPGTPMPWGAFGRMTDDDLRSIYRYLRSLPPFKHDTGPRIQDK